MDTYYKPVAEVPWLFWKVELDIDDHIHSIKRLTLVVASGVEGEADIPLGTVEPRALPLGDVVWDVKVPNEEGCRQSVYGQSRAQHLCLCHAMVRIRNALKNCDERGDSYSCPVCEENDRFYGDDPNEE